jgi:hypothetical protein
MLVREVVVVRLELQMVTLAVAKALVVEALVATRALVAMEAALAAVREALLAVVAVAVAVTLSVLVVSL